MLFFFVVVFVVFVVFVVVVFNFCLVFFDLHPGHETNMENSKKHGCNMENSKKMNQTSPNTQFSPNFAKYQFAKWLPGFGLWGGLVKEGMA